MRISIFGLGYVGCVGMGCLASMGHKIIGVDLSIEKVSLINEGKATIVEKDIDEYIQNGKIANNIIAISDSKYAVLNSDISFICVGTPNTANGHLDMSSMYAVAIEIGKAIKEKLSHHTIVIRSTVMPGTNSEISKILEKESGKKMNIDFGVVSNPEFLREGCAVNDFFNPPYTIIASDDNKALAKMKELYETLDSEIIETDIQIAEMIKFLNNSYHALKVVFANEIGRLCKKINIDGRKLMDVFCKDSILNISPYYFKPGFAYGGSCLPKDLKALQLLMHDNYVQAPVISAVGISNEMHIKHAENLIISFNKRKLSFISISFKDGTDDLRFSPALEVVERMIGKGYNVHIFDQHLNLSRLMGKNKEYLYKKLPHIEALLMDSIEDAIEFGDVIILSNKEKYIEELLISSSINDDKVILDFNGFSQDISTLNKIEGICW